MIGTPASHNTVHSSLVDFDNLCPQISSLSVHLRIPVIALSSEVMLGVARLHSFGRQVYLCCSLVGSITGADAARWAAHFATVSYGDALFASALALLLRPNMPAPVQVPSPGTCVSFIAMDILFREV